MTACLLVASLMVWTASAYAADFGSLYRFSDKFTMAAVLANVGTRLTFLDQHDPLPRGKELESGDERQRNGLA